MSFDPIPYAEGIKRLNEAERARILKRASAAREEAARLARKIKSGDLGVRSVILYGFLAEGVQKNPDFDIDLAIADGDSYAAMDAAADSSFSVDIVDFDRLPEAFGNEYASAECVCFKWLYALER